MVLVRFEYLRSDSEGKLLIGQFDLTHISNKWNSKAQTCSKTFLGCRRVAEECLFAQNWGKIFQRWKSGHFVRIQRVIWDHLLGFNAEIILKQALF